MKKYQDYKKKGSKKEPLTNKEIQKVDFTKFVIVVPTEKDKKVLREAFEHIHYSDINTDFVPVNQLAHMYLDEAEHLIVVDKKRYKKLRSEKVSST